MAVQNLLSVLDGVGPSVQAIAYGGTAQPAAPVVALIANDGVLYVPNGVVTNAAAGSVGLNGGTSYLALRNARKPDGTVLAAAAATNTFALVNTVGSAGSMVLASGVTNNTSNSGSFIQTFEIPSGYVAGTNLNFNLATNLLLVAGGTLTVKTINAQIYPIGNAGALQGTFGASVTNGTAQTIPTGVGTVTFAMTGTGTFVVGQTLEAQVDYKLTETGSQNGQVLIGGIYLS